MHSIKFFQGNTNEFAIIKKEIISLPGEMAEWFKAHAWKACKEETLSWVRIPFSPPTSY